MPEEKNKNQLPKHLRYSDDELILIKQMFSDNVELLKALQRAFLQLPLSVNNLSILQISNIKGNKNLINLLQKIFLPKIEDDVYFTEIWDYHAGIDFKGKLAEQIVADIKATDVLVAYYDQQLKALEKGEWNTEQDIKIKDLTSTKNKTDEQIYIDLLARNNILGTIAGRVQQLYILAGQKDETPEEQKRRLSQDSAK